MGSWYEAEAPIGGSDWFEVAEESNRLPLLMAPPTNGAKNSRARFIDIFNLIKTDLILSSSEPQNCIGSSHGWLILFDVKTSRIILQNPLTKSQIRLPPLSEDTAIVHKVILSGNPAKAPKEECTAMIIFGEDRELAFVRRGEKSWTVIEDAGDFFEDVIHYANKFFAVAECGRVVKIDLIDSDSQPEVMEITEPWFFRGVKTYLAGTPWGLWLIIRNLDTGGVCRRDKFEVYNLQCLENSCCFWERVYDLSGRMLFLGKNHSVSIRSTPDTMSGRDCIFFTDGVDGEQAVGCFEMENQMDIPLSWCSQSRKKTSVRPTWVIHESS